MSDYDDDDHDRLFPNLTPEDVLRRRVDWDRGDVLVTLWLTSLAGVQARDTKSADEAGRQLRDLIADDPDPLDLIHKLVTNIGLHIMSEAHEAGLPPLEYWQQRQLKRADWAIRSAEILTKLRWRDIPDDILEAEKRRLWEQRERDAAEDEDDQRDDDTDA